MFDAASGRESDPLRAVADAYLDPRVRAVAEAMERHDRDGGVFGDDHWTGEAQVAVDTVDELTRGWLTGLLRLLRSTPSTLNPQELADVLAQIPPALLPDAWEQAAPAPAQAEAAPSNPAAADDAAGTVVAAVPAGVSDRQRQMVLALWQEPPMTVTQIAARTGLTREAVLQIVRELPAPG